MAKRKYADPPVRDYELLGTFELTGTELRVSDPCYDKDTWCAGVIHDMAPGIYEAYKAMVDDEFWGRRVAILAVRHAELGPEIKAANECHVDEDNGVVIWGHGWAREAITVGVDSGQCGLYDEAHFRDEDAIPELKNQSFDDSKWDSLCCDLTLREMQGGVLPYGAVTSSGCGDGSYDAFVYRDNGRGTMACVLYM